MTYAYESPINQVQTRHAQNLTIDAIKLIDKGDWNSARDKIAESKDPLAAKIFYWLKLTRGDQENLSSNMFIALSGFIRDNPEWPDRSKMVMRAEGFMPESLSNAEVIAWYDNFTPQTPYGMARYADALIIEGKHSQAKTFIAQWWASSLISRDQQKEIFQKYNKYMTPEAHKRRLNMLLHSDRYDSATGVAQILGNGYPELTRARIALSQNKSNVGGLIDAVPSHLQNTPGLLYERLKWRRKRKLNDGAAEILLINLSQNDIYNRAEWWTERHIIIRRFLEQGQYAKAYEIASKHVQQEGFSNAQAQWLAGWLALRFMNKPEQAYERFSALYAKVKTPVSKARATYWSGRAAEAMGQMGMARDWYKKASQFQTVYYGQMAGATLSKDLGLPKNKLPRLSSSDYDKFEKSELYQSFEIFKSAKQKIYADRFINAFLSYYETPKAYRFAAESLAKKDDFFNAVKIAKKASYKGMFLTKQAYPTITKHLQDVNYAEWALIHALIRQESMFDFSAQSHAGALGLMQIMPSTARELAKKMNVQYSQSWLIERPKYNIHMGSYYIGMLIDRYEGSYPLAIAAYNAGPGRVDRWIKQFGDPRAKEIDMVDWIELIPIYETRNYVQRVLENTHIYRLRLNNIQSHPVHVLHVDFHSKP